MPGPVLPLTYGWVWVPKSVSVAGAPNDVMLREPIPGVLVDVGNGWLLIDTGVRRAVAEAGHGYTWELPGRADPLVDAFTLVGVDPADVVAVALSHLHLDHAGGLHHFAERVPVFVQRAELDYALSRERELESHGFLVEDFDLPVDWRVVEGDAELAPGVTGLATPGHTPGHMSFLVERGPGPPILFACDAADLEENIEREVPVGGAIGVPPEATLGALLRLKSLAAERRARLVPGHDPLAWPRLTAELGVPAW